MVQANVKRQADFCAVFDNPRRILILWALAEQERSVGEIAEVIQASLQNTSQHLRLMRDRGILTSRRDGSTVYYRIVRSNMLDECGLLNRKFERNL